MDEAREERGRLKQNVTKKRAVEYFGIHHEKLELEYLKHAGHIHGLRDKYETLRKLPKEPVEMYSN